MPQSPKESKRKIGVYGRTQAGKTQFLYTLLHHWQQGQRISKQSASCQDFLRIVGGQVDLHGHTVATTANTKSIEVTIRDRDPDAVHRTRYDFHDLRGELLEGDIDSLDSLTKPNQDGLIVSQVRYCDAFLFFFDPTSWENPDRLAEHHACELRRAKLFVDHVMKARQNKYLPIVFVITRLDLWQNDPEVAQLTTQWIEKARQMLCDSYQTYLAPHYPQGLVDETRVTRRVSTIRPADVEAVIDEVALLVHDCWKFRRQDRKRTKPILFAVGFAVVAFALIAYFLAIDITSSKSPHSSETAPSTESDLVARMQEFEILLSQHPTRAELVTLDQAAVINVQLRWLVDAGAAIKQSGDAATLQQARRLGDETHALIARQFERPVRDLRESFAIVAAYLTGVSDASLISDSLGEIQRLSFWDQYRGAIVVELAETLQPLDRVAAPAEESLLKLSGKLKAFEREVKQADFFGPEKRKSLLEELRTGYAFCDKYHQQLFYDATIQILSARLESENRVQAAVHAVQLWPDTRFSRSYSLTPSPESDSVLTFTTAGQSYDLAMPLSRTVRCAISKYTNGSWNEVNRFDLTGDGGPLTVLGMPLHSRTNPNVLKQIQSDGYTIKLEFNGLPIVPDLIWNTVLSMKTDVDL